MLLRSVFIIAITAATTVDAFTFVPQHNVKQTTWILLNNEGLGAGGMADTRNPDPVENEDARKSISAAPSFEEYMKMRQGSEQGSATTTAVTTPSSPSAAATPMSQQSSSSSGGGADAIATLDASQAATINKISLEIIDLAPKPDFTWTAADADGITINGCATTIDARDAAGPANVAWLAGACVSTKLSSMTIYNGPLTDVPHILSTCILDDNNQLKFKLDFRPRCYGAYELKKADGTYPGPDELGRKSFEYSSARNEFDNKFGNDDMKTFLSNTISSFTDAVTYDDSASATEEELLTHGPLYMSYTMPNTDNNVQAIAAAREKAIDFWLDWMKDGNNSHRPGAPINSQHVYDTKFKLNAYGALLKEYSNMYGSEDGQKLAVGESGPLDEAYVGGGS